LPAQEHFEITRSERRAVSLPSAQRPSPAARCGWTASWIRRSRGRSRRRINAPYTNRCLLPVLCRH